MIQHKHGTFLCYFVHEQHSPAFPEATVPAQKPPPQMSVELQPCDVNGNVGPWDDDDSLDPFVDDPAELLGVTEFFHTLICLPACPIAPHP